MVCRATRPILQEPRGPDLSQGKSDTSACLDDNAVAHLLAGEGSAEEQARAAAHLDGCDDCRALVGLAGRAEPSLADAGPPRPRGVLPAGTRLARYVVLETIGAGAMGVVYAAYDPELHRRVALKLLRPDPSSDPLSSPARGRLLREAQALARLAHPNVVTVHDVGTLDGEVFLAMEFVEGGTLRDWLRAAPRGWREVLALLRQAGEGLAAAHDAGLVHRDFKPDNVLVGAGERARVTDFGLAQPEGAPPPVPVAGGAAPRALDTRLTATGTLVGTPAYMAPEQLARGPATAISDQFAFAATLFEALTGERPFAGESVAALAGAIASGRVTQPARRPPAFLRKVLARGLQSDPADRFPSLRALLSAIDRGPPLGARHLAVALALALVVALALAPWRRSEPLCTGAAAAWGKAWDAPRAQRVHVRFKSTGAPSAEEEWLAVRRLLDAEATRWRSLHQEACEATRVRGDQSEFVLDARMHCLEERRGEIDALAALFEQADRALVAQALGATLKLPALEACKAGRALTVVLPLPADAGLRARIEKASQQVAQANALEYTGQYASGLALAESALPEARATGHAPLLARLLLAIGKLQKGAGDYAKAEGTLHEAAGEAQVARDDTVVADAWTALVRVAGFHLDRPAEGRVWAHYAQAAIERAGGDDEREATRLRTLATVVWRRQGARDEARALIERARALYQKSPGTRFEAQIASCDEGIAGILFDQARPGEALPLHRRALETRQRLFGADHPSLATAFVNLGEDLTKLGRAEEALPFLRKAVALSAGSESRGGDAYFRHRLAAALRATGDGRAALAEDLRALAASAKAGQTGGYWESWPLTGQGLDLLLLGRAKEAVAPLEQAVRERREGTLPIEIAETRFALAQALWQTGARPRARSLARQASEALRPDAERYGSWYAGTARQVEEWLAAHRW